MHYLKSILFTLLVFALLLPIESNAQKLNTDLIKAAKKGKIDNVHTLLQEGANINATDKKGRTALMFAAEKGKLGVVKLLLESGAEIDLEDIKGETAKVKAQKKKKTEIVIIIEFARAQKQDTKDSYQRFLSNFPNSNSSNAAKKRIRDIRVQEEKLAFKKTQTVDTESAYKKFLKQYPAGSFANKAKEKIVEKSFDNAQQINTIYAFEKFLKDHPNASFSQAARENLKQRNEKYKSLKSVIMSYTEDKKRQAEFGVFLNENFSTNKYDFKTFENFIEEFTLRCREDKKLLPRGKADRDFFFTFFELRYLPTLSTGIPRNDFKQIMSVILRHYQEFIGLYDSKFEKAYLTHNIGRVTCLVMAQERHGSFSALALWNLTSSSFGSIGDAFQQTYGSGRRGSSFLNDFDLRTEFQTDMISLYKNSVYNLFSFLEDGKANLKTRLYILERLFKWVELVNIGEGNKELLAKMSKTDKSQKVRKLSVKVLKNSRF